MLNNPLRILFFGSDKFSLYSLQKLYNLHQGNHNLIESLQIVSRPPKWGGKKRSTLRTPKILEDISSFSTLPPAVLCDNRNELLDKLLPLIEKHQFNMLICVSFGLLIPQQLIEKVPHTLNLHPSLLPRYMGSSPIQKALLNNDKYTGITIQSLHPTKFDKGEIIAQSEELEISELLQENNHVNEIPIYSSRLTDSLGQRGSNLLGDVIENHSYLKPSNQFQLRKYQASLAPRIQTTDKLVQWRQEDATQIFRRLMTLGPLYTFIKCGYNEKTGDEIIKRVIIHSFSVIGNQPTQQSVMEPGSFQFSGANNEHMKVFCHKGTAINVISIQMGGSKVAAPSQFFTTWQKQVLHRNKNSPQAPCQFLFYSE